MTRVPVTSFLAGELSDKMAGRFDLAAYGAGAAELTNWLPIAQGGVTLRPGSEFMGFAGDQSRTLRLVPFVVNGDTAFVLEFGENTLRFWKNGSLVSSGGTPVSVATPYTVANLWDIQVAQNGTSLYLVHRDRPIKVLTWSAGDIFTMADMAFNGAAWTASTAYAEGSIVFRVDQLYYCVQAGTSGTTGPTLTHYDSETDLETDGTVLWRWIQAMPFRSPGNYPGCVAFFEGRMWFASTDNEPQALWASRPYEPNNFLMFDVLNFKNRQLVDPQTYSFVGTSNGDRVLSVATDPREFCFVGQYISGPTVEGVEIVTPGTKIVSVEASNITVDQDITETTSQLYSATWWPSTTSPQYETVTTIRDVVSEGSAIKMEVASDQNNRVTFLAAARALLMGTMTDEWIIPSGVSAVALSAQLQTRIGSAAVQGRLYGANIIFLQGDRKHLREYVYRDAEAAYHSPNLTFQADHILGSGGLSFDFIQSPDPLALFTTEDGHVAVLAYNADYSLQAWTRFSLGGSVESVAVVPGQEGHDVAYVAVNRAGVRTIERMGLPFDGYHLDQGVRLTRGVPNSVGGYTVLLSGSTITGVSWLANKTVSLVGGGLSESVTVAANGSIAVPAAFSSVNQINVGFPFIATIRTMKLTTEGDGGIAQGAIKRLGRVILRLYKTTRLTVGSGEPVVLDSADFTGDKMVNNPDGWGTGGQVKIVSDNGLPASVFGIYVEVQG